jgi:hypothetical protein
MVFTRAEKSVNPSDSIQEQQMQSVTALAEQAVEYLMELDALKPKKES